MSQLKDSFGRQIKYLRLSVTDRCNLRCTYCMPERGMKFASKPNLFSTDEMIRLVSLLGNLGIEKIRFTGGEPFVREGFMDVLKGVVEKSSIKQIGITTNLTIIEEYIDDLKGLGIKDINASLDAVDSNKFFAITRRNDFGKVWKNLTQLLDHGFNLKLNCVVMKGVNEDQIQPMLDIAKEYPVAIRFLEEMPFNGLGVEKNQFINYTEILSRIKESYEYTRLIDSESSTSMNYKIDGFQGSFGVIPSFSRTFCGTCDRLRISATGAVRTCLYGKDQANVLTQMRNGASDEELSEWLITLVKKKEKDGFDASDQNDRKYLSMTKLGG